VVPRAAPITPLRFSTGGMRELAGELRALNERRVVLPLEPVAGSVVHADLAQWPYPQLGILAATLGGLRLSRVVLGKDYGTKPLPHDLRSKCHCERSEAIFARTQRLLRHLQLLAMTAPPSGFLSAAGFCLTALIILLL
jgi:hypothetical protein